MYMGPILNSFRELLHCTGVGTWHPILSFAPAILRPIRFSYMGLDEEWSLQNKNGYTRRSALSHNGYHQHKGTSRCTQTSNMSYPHTSCKVQWCWQRNFRICIILGKLYQLCHLNNKYRYYEQYVISLYQQFCNCTVK